MNNEFESMWKEAVVAALALSRRWPGRTEKYNDNVLAGNLKLVPPGCESRGANL
jgi:hypothetical protein